MSKGVAKMFSLEASSSAEICLVRGPVARWIMPSELLSAVKLGPATGVHAVSSKNQPTGRPKEDEASSSLAGIEILREDIALGTMEISSMSTGRMTCQREEQVFLLCSKCACGGSFFQPNW